MLIEGEDLPTTENSLKTGETPFGYAVQCLFKDKFVGTTAAISSDLRP